MTQNYLLLGLFLVLQRVCCAANQLAAHTSVAERVSTYADIFWQTENRLRKVKARGWNIPTKS